MCASLSQTILPKALGTNTQTYYMVVDFLSEMTVGDIFVEGDLDGLVQNQSLIRKALNHLIVENKISALQIGSCSDCSCLIENDTICLSCGLDNSIGHNLEKLQGFKLANKINRSPDSFWQIDDIFFNIPISAQYSDGSILCMQASLGDGEILLHSSAIKEGLCPQIFKVDDCSYNVVSEQIFFPKFGNRKRHYNYSIKLKETKTMKNTVNNYGTIGTLNQSIQTVAVSPNDGDEELNTLIDLILKNMDSSAPSFLNNRQKIKELQDENGFYTKASEFMSLLSSVITVASFDLSNAIEKITRLIK